MHGINAEVKDLTGGKTMGQNKSSENREYKSDVFSMLMKVPEYALDVYNALNESDYKDPALVEMKTLDKCISLTVRNDAAFIIDMNLNIYEHQSTYNPNMPLRVLIYVADILRPFIKDKTIYSSRIIEIPTPKFVVFYNGTQDRPAKEIQRLSDMYKHDENINIELICTVYNINPGKNDDIKDKSYVLSEYTVFVEKVRQNLENGVVSPVEEAVNYCIENDVLKKFLKENKDEVIKNMTIDMTFERQLELVRKEEQSYGLRALINVLKPILKTQEAVLENIVAQEGYENTTIEEIKKYWDVC